LIWHADIRSELTALLRAALQSVAPESRDASIVLERPKQASHGDFASNLALQLAKPLKLNPRDIAGRSRRAAAVVAGRQGRSGRRRLHQFHAGPGGQAARRAGGAGPGRRLRPGTLGGGKKVQVEFVSANPTGPLHVGHGRGAAYGASLANLLDFAGFEVTREFYVNDAGRQMDILALSTWLRYLELHGSTIPSRPTPTRATTCATWRRHLRGARRALTAMPPARARMARRRGRGDAEGTSTR
jgi:arginyl-tRNA synthetase